MKGEITNEEKERIYKKLLKDYNLDDSDEIVVVGENSEKLEKRLRYIAENDIL